MAIERAGGCFGGRNGTTANNRTLQKRLGVWPAAVQRLHFHSPPSPYPSFFLERVSFPLEVYLLLKSFLLVFVRVMRLATSWARVALPEVAAAAMLLR